MEDDIKLRCLSRDNDVVKSVLNDAKKEYAEFIKKETGLVKTVNIEVVESVPLEKSDTE
jgi:hypothetical protein